MIRTGGADRARVRLGRRAVLVGLTMAALSSCTTMLRNHGFAPSDADLAQITVGVDTRETVRTLIGPPTSGGVLADSGFYYVASTFRYYGALEPKEIDRQLVAINFAANGTVSNISRYTLADGQVVTLSRRVTDDNIKDRTLIRQLLGNIGRFDAGSMIGSDS